jgi:beta-lactamase class A
MPSARHAIRRAALLTLLTAPAVTVPTVVAAQERADRSSTTETSPADDPALERLARELARLEPISEGAMGVAAVHVETGRAVYLNPDEPFPMASTYKVPIAVQLLTRVDHGEIALTDMVELEPGDLHPGSGTLTRLFDDPGVVLSRRNLLELMLLISDNSATDLTLEAAGGGEVVTARMHSLGIDGIRVDRPTSLLIGDFVGLEDAPEDGRISPEMWEEMTEDLDEAAAAKAAEHFAADPQDTSTPRGMAELLEAIWRGRAVSPESTALLIDILERVETGGARLKGALPPGTTVAHKTGTIGRTTNDVGVIYLPDDAGHVITVVFVKDSEASRADAEAAIAQAARAVHDFFLFQPR